MEFDFVSGGISDSFFEEDAFLDLTEISVGSRNPSPNDNLLWSDHNPFEPNSIGLRGPDPAKVDLLAAGCSQTFGIGVEEQDAWPAVLSKMTNMSYANIGLPGGSTQAIVNSSLAYMRDYGNPKVLCVVLPDLFRMTIATRSDILVWNPPRAPKKDPSLKQVLTTTIMRTRESTSNNPTYSKRPHEVEDIIPYEVAMYLSMMAINYLIEYCRAADITLLMSSWHPATQSLIEEKKARGVGNLDLSGYLPLEGLKSNIHSPTGSIWQSHDSCHSNPGTSPHWDISSDKTHMGVHQHLHYAEAFAKRINATTKN